MLQKLNNPRNKFIKTQRMPFHVSRERFLQQKINGATGSTWDATHLTSFLHKSFYSNKKSPEDNQQGKSYSMRRKKDGDFFFKNLRYDQNKSHIGYTKVNPLIASSEVSQQRQQALMDLFISKSQKMSQAQREQSPPLRCSGDAMFKFQGNQLKFRATDPITLRYESQKQQKVGYSIERMKRQIASRHPHGLTGIDHPQNSQSLFYETSKEKQTKIREHPISQTSFQLDREWRRKKRVAPIAQAFKFRQTECIRKFRNQNSHGYNILTNRNIQE